MKQVIFDDPYFKKKSNDMKIDQLECIKHIYLNIIDNSKLESISKDKYKDIESVLKKKYSSYKSQDKQSHKYDTEQHITYEEMIEKICKSELKCYYCNCELSILYNKKREKKQWTLERLDNNLGHYASNTCISCLECNLRRRTDNYEYFKESKQTKIVKIE